MDEETKLKLDDLDRKATVLDKKIDDQGKRFDDVKWFVGGSSLIFSVLVLIAGWNYNTERGVLRDFEKEIRELVSKTDETRMDLYAINGMDLAGQEISAEVLPPPPGGTGDFYLVFSFVLRNTGENTSGPTYLKLYTKEDLKLAQKSSDDARYQYEDYLTPKTLTPDSIPAKMSIIHDLRFFLPPPASISPGKHAALLKVYYGKGKVVSAPIYLLTH